MRLSTLVKPFISLPLKADVDVTRLILDSRESQRGDLFIAMRGTSVDGRHFIQDVLSRQVAAILVESDDAELAITYQQTIPIIPVGKLREKLGEIAAIFYGHPAQYMKMYGITGTNGKTSCANFLAQMFDYFKLPCGLMGTLGSGLYGALGEPGLTTPDAVTLHAMLKTFVAAGAKATVMEVSSHSIDQGRVNHIAFEAGIFTNLTQDHLDYHGSMEAYAAVKKHYLEAFSMKHVIMNVDDPYGKSWIMDFANHRPVVAYSLQCASLPQVIPQVYTEQTTLSLSGIKTRVVSPWGTGELQLPLIGEFNLSNILAVLTTLCLQEIPFDRVLHALSSIQAVPGRMQLLGGQNQPLIVVDFSHTPDSLLKALQALKHHTKGKLICVFGCGGNRDGAKRPLMAAVAEQWADVVMVTSDNPRHEDPADIVRQIVSGFQHPEAVLVELDRSKAIEKSIQYASVGDCILIAGKGAERYQQIGDQKHPFDDVSEVNRYLDQAVKEPHGDS